jgi:hypothetical protein
MTSLTNECQDIADTFPLRGLEVGQGPAAMAQGVSSEAKRRVRTQGPKSPFMIPDQKKG